MERMSVRKFVTYAPYDMTYQLASKNGLTYGAYVTVCVYVISVSVKTPLFNLLILKVFL